MIEDFDKWKARYESGERTWQMWRQAMDLEYRMVKCFQMKEITPRLDYLQSKIRKQKGEFNPLISPREFMRD